MKRIVRVISSCKQKVNSLVGNYPLKTMSDKMHYVNLKRYNSESGATVEHQWGIHPKGLKVLRGWAREGEDLPIEFKNSKNPKKAYSHGT